MHSSCFRGGHPKTPKSDKVRVRQLTKQKDDELRLTEPALCNSAKAERVRVIVLSAQGLVPARFPALSATRCSWYTKIIHRFNPGRIQTIARNPRTDERGRPRKYSDGVVQRIIETAKSPRQQLMGMTQWFLAKLGKYLIEQGIVEDIGLEWLRQILKRVGVRLRRTKT